MYSSSAGKNTRALTVFRGPYINLTFQDGPIKECGENGTTNEEIIQLLISRIQSLDLIMHSEYNDGAIMNLENTLMMLQQRTLDRERRNVEGTSKP